MLPDVHVRDTRALAVFVVDVFAIQHHHNVRILFDRSGVSQIRENRTRRRALLDEAGKPRKRDDGATGVARVEG
jgi:hypothetical protein